MKQEEEECFDGFIYHFLFREFPLGIIQNVFLLWIFFYTRNRTQYFIFPRGKQIKSGNYEFRSVLPKRSGEISWLLIEIFDIFIIIFFFKGWNPYNAKFCDYFRHLHSFYVWSYVKCARNDILGILLDHKFIRVFESIPGIANVKLICIYISHSIRLH